MSQIHSGKVHDFEVLFTRPLTFLSKDTDSFCAIENVTSVHLEGMYYPHQQTKCLLREFPFIKKNPIFSFIRHRVWDMMVDFITCSRLKVDLSYTYKINWNLRLRLYILRECINLISKQSASSGISLSLRGILFSALLDTEYGI